MSIGVSIIQEIIGRLVQRQNLTRQEAAAAMAALMTGEATPAQVAGFLVALHMKGETVDEITGLAETMRAMATKVTTNRRPLIDTCGTGGDHSGTFNISTTAAFVVAGAGVAVAKHGNRSATSQCGSADVLEALGVNIDANAAQVGQCIDRVGIGFLFARTLHTAMRHVAGPRTELRVRTIFNILGPLTNPAEACGQVIGVFDSRLIEPLAHVLANLGSRHAFVVAGSDGLDEITLAGPSMVAEAKGGEVKTYQLEPGVFGLNIAPRESILGGNAKHNAAILREVLQGKRGPHRDIVLLNAAPAIIAGCGAEDWPAGIRKAAESIDSGAAWAACEALVKESHLV
jgi:anthranilate phosphoribosyltransferase